MKPLSLLFLIVSFTLPLRAGVEEKTDARLSRALAVLPPGGRTLAWVFFTDKGTHEQLAPSVPHTMVSERSLLRRAKVRAAGALVDYADLPVEQSYVRQVAGLATAVRQQSKWMNGVSVVATRSQLQAIEALPCVRALECVARFRRGAVETETPDSAPPLPPPEGITSFNYGASLNQVNQINVPAVHDRNNYGQGVVVGVFDNGFRLLNHEVFDTLRPRIIATYDFVDHKVGVAPNNPDTDFGGHGVNTLSTIGGFKSGQLIGPAFGATYILARTENDSSETPFEEDNWVAAIEWADSIGVDVTSTSLGYLTYDTAYTSWTWEDMDGNTTVITRAADMAAGRGILVVNSAGNEGDNLSHNTLGAPADGDSVFTIGAVSSSGTRVSFSSVGPTTSVPPRIKPDVMAQGSTVRVASAINPTGYGSSQGTSFSCPLAAGVAALMVHARPTASPMEIMNTLRSTASRASAPDNRYGWGILNVLAALSPTAIAPLIPPDAAPDRDTVLFLSWARSPWATGYRLQLATTSLFTTLLLDDSTITDTARVVGGLAHGSTYYWRVAARNVYGASTYSPVWSFATSSAPPAAVTLLAPADGAIDVPTAATLTWNSAPTATRYHVQAAGDSAFTSLFADDSTVTATSTIVAGLPPGSVVFWKVRAGNGAGWSAESPAWRFATAPGVVRTYGLSAGWNIVSLPLSVPDPTPDAVFPAAVSPLFHFTPAAGYRTADTLDVGNGYWLKFDAPESVAVTGDVVWSDSIPVAAGWNLVGAISGQVDTAAVLSSPPGIRVSGFYRFDTPGGYQVDAMLQPGRGYWVKSAGAGMLILQYVPGTPGAGTAPKTLRR